MVLMSKGKPDIRIGTSGWYYGHWAGLFYPEGLPKSKWFGYYVKHFDTVEINNTFYQLPKPISVKKWYAQAPTDFVYSVKANRFITHIKKLQDPSDAVGARRLCWGNNKQAGRKAGKNLIFTKHMLLCEHIITHLSAVEVKC